jgi:MFS family permease
MKRHQHRWYTPALSPQFIEKPTTALLLFSSFLFLLLLGDAIMSYFAPVFINDSTQSTFTTGLILSSSSLVGFAADIFLGEYFKRKSLAVFLSFASLGALAYPLSYLALPPHLLSFLIAMAIWGIYYELMLFAKFHFINRFLPHHAHGTGWAVLGGFTDAAYLIGPVLAGALLNLGHSWALITAIGFTLAGILGSFIFQALYRQKLQAYTEIQVSRPRLAEELAVWQLLIPKIWPVLLVVFILTALDATMWSVGAILSERLISGHQPLGEMIFVAYLVPSLFFSYLSVRFFQNHSKKQTSFIFGLFAGLSYILAGLTPSSLGFIALIFLGSICSAVMWPHIRAVMQDYVERLGHAANLMISLQNSTTSLAYVFGSIISGYIASVLGDQKTFSVMGLFLLVSSAIGLAVLGGRKVSLPQQQTQSITNPHLVG